MTIPLANSPLDGEFPRPKDVGVLAMEVYFPRRVGPRFGLLKTRLTIQDCSSASPSLTSKNLMVSQKANTQLVLGRSTWPGPTTVKTSTLSL